ncbi:beta-lactamase family protein [Sphingomonas sinipercae]|uniref:Beta-lactamase family protein n=1 Tax=Sphingomonas sinipercae TaxID=2714944 RepID=A0A6G7ZLH4_9SPHN|nr:serine hydrolase domain-containing protein [Sphingomonas sinipercae]QIL01775.1 beta-lactamase family protein [Sphingomonas sinipercae]
MRKTLWLTVSLAVAFPSAIATAQDNQTAAAAAVSVAASPSDDAIRSMIARYVDKGEAKGIVVGILEPDGRRRYVSYGSGGGGAAPLGPDSVFEIGSLNKTFTASVLADMVRRGEVGLDDPISKYLPASVRVPSRNGKAITLRHLATHMSGLPRLPEGYVPPRADNPYADYKETQLYAFLNRYQLVRDPGEKMEYSNLGAGLLGHVLARAAKAKDFKTLVQTRILNPLKMTSTRFGPTPRLVAGHDKEGREVTHWDVAVLSGAGGLNASARDMLAFIDANVGPAETRIEKSLRIAHQPNVIDASTGRKAGLAWSIRERDGRTLLTHSGGTAGFRSFMVIEPKRNTGVVVLTNSGGFDGVDNIAAKIMFPPR